MKKNEKWNVNVNELIYQRIEGICQRGAALIPYGCDYCHFTSASDCTV